MSISTLREVEQPQHPATSAVGLDWGVASFVSLSNGEVIEQLQPLKKFLPRLASYNAACKGVVSGTQRSDSGAIVRLRAVGIPSIHGPFTEGRMSTKRSCVIHDAGHDAPGRSR